MFNVYKAHIIQNCTQIAIYFKNYENLDRIKTDFQKIKRP